MTTIEGALEDLQATIAYLQDASTATWDDSGDCHPFPARPTIKQVVDSLLDCRKDVGQIASELVAIVQAQQAQIDKLRRGLSKHRHSGTIFSGEAVF